MSAGGAGRALGFRDVRAAARRAYEHAHNSGALVVYTYGLSMSFAAGYVFGRWEVGQPSFVESVSCQASTGSQGSLQFVGNIISGCPHSAMLPASWKTVFSRQVQGAGVRGSGSQAALA